MGRTKQYRRSRRAADADTVFLESDEHLRALMTALSRFAQSARYHNLDVIGGCQPETNDPEQEWQHIEMELVNERPELSKALLEPGSTGEIYDAIRREFVGRIEVFVRALCRLFTLGPLGEEARRFTGYLTPFLFLRDDDLSTRDYRTAR